MGKRAHLLVKGIVQGVFYRVSARQEARRLHLSGFARNLPDGRVEIVAEGEEAALTGFIRWCQRGPQGAHVQEVKLEWEVPLGDRRPFEIR